MRITKEHLRTFLKEPLSVLGAPMRRQRIAMFHVGRSGSTVLADLINQHWDICWQGEIYSPHLDGWNDNASLPQETRQNQLKKITAGELAKAGPLRSCGFEVKFFHLALAGLSISDYVSFLDVIGVKKIIVLERKNALRKVVSSVIGHKDGNFHLAVGKDPSKRGIELNIDKIDIDYGSRALLNFLSLYEECFSELRNTLRNRNVLELSYEDDVGKDPLIAYSKVCEYLGVKPRGVRVRYARTNPFPLREIITNWSTVAAALSNTRFQWMLDE